MRYLRNPPSNVVIFHLRLHSASMRRSRGREGGRSIDPTRPQEGSEPMWFGSTYRKWVPPRAFFHISRWNCHKVPAWSKKHRLEHFFFFFPLRIEILCFKILKVVGCQLFLCPTLLPHMPDRMFHISRYGDMSHSKQTDWTSFILLLVGGLLLLSQLNPAFFLLKGCRLVLSYSDRVRMYQMGSFKAGSARLQTWKHCDPAALHGLALGASWKTFPSFPSKERFTSQAFGNITTQRLLRPCWEQCCGGWNRHPMVGQRASVNDANDVSVADSPELAHRRPACPLNLLIRHLDKNTSSLINEGTRDKAFGLISNVDTHFFFFGEKKA